MVTQTDASQNSIIAPGYQCGIAGSTSRIDPRTISIRRGVLKLIHKGQLQPVSEVTAAFKLSEILFDNITGNDED